MTNYIFIIYLFDWDRAQLMNNSTHIAVLQDEIPNKIRFTKPPTDRTSNLEHNSRCAHTCLFVRALAAIFTPLPHSLHMQKCNQSFFAVTH